MIVKIIILITFEVFAFNFNEGFNFLFLCVLDSMARFRRK